MQSPAADAESDRDSDASGDSYEDLSQLSCVAMGLTSITAAPGIGTAMDLRQLCLHENRIASLDGLAHLTALRTLELSSNSLTTVAQGLAALTGLRSLQLTANLLTETDGFGGLVCLRHLVS